MQKHQIITQLFETHKQFITTIQSLSDDDFLFSNNGKWTAGQQLEHIFRSAFPMARVTGDANFKATAPFGKATRPSANYDTVYNNYITGLGPGFTGIGKFAPGTVTIQQREEFIQKLNQSLATLATNLHSFTEEELDLYLVPHPFLGNLTIRETLYLIDFHCKHHHNQTLKNLQAKPTT